MAYQMYRSTTLGEALEHVLDDFQKDGVLPPNLVKRVMDVFDKSFTAALSTKVKNKYSYKAEKLRAYRFCDNVWTFVIEDVSIRDIENFFNKSINRDRVDSTGSCSTVISRSSDLEKNHVVESLHDVFKNPDVQLFFIQYMESVNQLELVKFFLHIESFKASFDALDDNPESLEHIKTDASNVYSQYLANGASMPIDLPDSIKNHTIECICPKDGNLKSNCFDEAQSFALELLENRYYKEFLTSVYYAKFLLELCTSGSLNIYDILGIHTILCAFLEYLEAAEDDHGQNLLEFIINVRDSEQAKSSDPETLVEDAMVIYDKYFSMQATNNLHFGDEIRIAVESKICTENGLPDNDSFEKPYNTACSELQKKYVPAFLNSTPLQKVVSQLSAFIEHHIDSPRSTVPPSVNPKQRSSSTTSATPASPRWTLPSRDRLRLRSIDKFIDGRRSTTSDDGIEDTASQCSGGSSSVQNNCNNNSSGCLAQIDEMGRYKPLFSKDVCIEELPGRGRIRSALDKYLNQSAAKENEMADEVAKLIIGDIQQMVSASNMAKQHNQI